MLPFLASAEQDDEAATDEAPVTREADPSHDDEAEVHPEVAAFLRPGDPGKRAGSCMELVGHMDHVTCAGTLDGGRTVVSSSVDDVFKVQQHEGPRRLLISPSAAVSCSCCCGVMTPQTAVLRG